MGYDIAGRVVEGDVVEGIEVVGEGRVYCDVGHFQHPQVGPPEYLDLYRKGCSCQPCFSYLVKLLSEVVVALVTERLPLYFFMP